MRPLGSVRGSQTPLAAFVQLTCHAMVVKYRSSRSTCDRQRGCGDGRSWRGRLRGRPSSGRALDGSTGAGSGWRQRPRRRRPDAAGARWRSRAARCRSLSLECRPAYWRQRWPAGTWRSDRSRGRLDAAAVCRSGRHDQAFKILQLSYASLQHPKDKILLMVGIERR